MQFVLTIDTEADDQWSRGKPLTKRNIDHWPRLHGLCVSYGVPVTYLVTSEIIAEARAQRLLGAWVESGTAEVGAHLHPWTTAPFADMPGLRRNDPCHAFPSQLPTKLLAAKLDTLTQSISTVIGHPPTSFRAGRFGFDARCARLLGQRGYIVDSSVTPLVDWQRADGLPEAGGGPDYRALDARPFLLSDTGDPGLLEIPVTIAVTFPANARGPVSRRLAASRPFRRLAGMMTGEPIPPQPVWLRPTPWFGASALIGLWQTCVGKQLPVAVMMFHSSELLPGGSPYRPTAASVDELYAVLERFFAFLKEWGITCTTLTAAARELLAAAPQLRERTL